MWEGGKGVDSWATLRGGVEAETEQGAPNASRFPFEFLKSQFFLLTSCFLLFTLSKRRGLGQWWGVGEIRGSNHSLVFP